MRRSVAVLAAVPVMLGCWAVSAQPAHAAGLTTIPLSVGVVNDFLITLTLFADNTASGDTETFTGAVAAGGIDLSAGTATATGNGGGETITVPLTSVGAVTDGEQVVVTVDDVETGFLHVADASDTVTLTCHLDSQGDGTCS